jgi:predicted outer membrane repeat protein
VNITDCRFENNEAVPEGGGAILFYAPQSVNLGVIRNSLFINNKATAGGAIRVVTFSAVGSAEGLLIQDCEFSGNSATTDGGALSFEDSSATLVNSKFSCNSARDGGALMFYNRVATTQFGLNMTENQLSGNVASRNGAALFISSVMTARLNSNLFDFNWGNQNGGAIFCERPTANVLFNGGSIIGNTANSTGGAYYSHNCTCSGAETVAVLNNHARALESTWGGDAASGSRCGSSVSTSLPIQDNLYPGDSESCNPAPQAQTGDTGDTPTRVVSGGSDGDGTPGSSPTGGAVATTTATALLFIAATALLLV